ncbi:MAG TPA: hypothetical protein VL357_00335 [Rariglobus sp.]|jgi:hypothetical protein|nr:hypothetical protein [Rariglobus sp.]
MRSALPLLLALSVAFPFGVRAEDATKVAPDQQNTQLAPGANNTDTRLAPGNADNQLPFKRDDRVQNSRFSTPELREKKLAPDADKRAPFDMTEAHEKNIIDRKDYPKPDVRENQMSPENKEMFYAQPKGDMLKSYNTVAKYQNRMTDAENAASQRQPKLEKRTTFDKINRFIFKRNGPGENGNPIVTPAGGGTTSTVSGGTQKTASAPPPPQLQPAGSRPSLP